MKPIAERLGGWQNILQYSMHPCFVEADELKPLSKAT